MISTAPAWLKSLERKLSWLAIPNIAVLLVTLQGLGFLMVMADPVWSDRLALVPDLVRAGQYWRLITFLALPISMSPFWALISLWFLYFIVNSIERQWGEFKTTLYVLVSVILTIAVSFALNYPVMEVTDFESTLFLAAAALFPEMVIQLFFVLPVKMKWLAWITLGFLAVRFFQANLFGKIFLLTIYSNYFLFFGPALADRLRHRIRREAFRRKMR